MKRYTMEVYGNADTGTWCQCELDEDGDWVKYDEALLLRKDRNDLLAMLEVITNELHAEFNETYSYSTDENGKLDPALIRRYERDMVNVRKAQALIEAIETAV